MKSLAMVLDCESIGIHGEAFAYGYVVVDLATGELREVRRRWCDPQRARGPRRNALWVEDNVPFFEPYSDQYMALGTSGCAEHGKRAHAQSLREGFHTAWSSWVERVGVTEAMRVSAWVQSARQVRDDFWAQWERLRSTCDLWADVGWPCEANFLTECARDARDGERNYDGPYPLCDVSTLLHAFGEVLPPAIADLPIVESATISRDGKPEPFCGGILERVFKHDPLGDAYVSARRLCLALARAKERTGGTGAYPGLFTWR